MFVPDIAEHLEKLRCNFSGTQPRSSGLRPLK
jgi:hypothetical protein